MDQEWQEDPASWRTSTQKYTVEVWFADGAYNWAAYNAGGEYIFAGRSRTLEIAKRESLQSVR